MNRSPDEPWMDRKACKLDVLIVATAIVHGPNLPCDGCTHPREECGGLPLKEQPNG